MTPVSSRRRLIHGLAGIAVAACSLLPFADLTAHAQIVQSGKVAYIQGPSYSFDCVFFTLEGVSVADPAVSNGQYFAIPSTHPGYKQHVATLHIAKQTGTSVVLGTTGTTSCGGYATVNWLQY